MSIFCVGGPQGIIVPMDEVNTTEHDVYFLPGILHGGTEYILQAWGWNAQGDDRGERIGIKYLWKYQIIEWAKEATINGVLNDEIFSELINEQAEEFIVDNDGTGDFVTINESWNQAVAWNYEELIAWAKGDVILTVAEYDHYKYAKSPLALVAFPEPVTDEQIVAILRCLDGLYGDTEQATSDWALEYQIWSRMMVYKGEAQWFLANTFAHNLQLTPRGIEEICKILGNCSENAKVFRTCVDNKEFNDFFNSARLYTCDEMFHAVFSDGSFAVREEVAR